MRSSLVIFLGIFGFALQPVVNAENLDEIYQLAVENDPVMRSAEASFRSQKEVKKFAFGSLLPQVAGEVFYNDQDSSVELPASDEETSGEDVVEGVAASIDTQKTQELGWQVGLKQKLFDLSSWYTFKSSQRLTESAEAEFISNQQSLVARTIEAYLNILKAQDNLASSVAEETAIKQQLDQTQQRFDVGLVAITDVHESQAAYDLAKVSRLVNQGALEVAYESLSLLTGRPHANIQTLSSALPISLPEPSERDEWVNLAQHGNLELQQARQAAEAAKYAAKATKAGHYPTLSASVLHRESDKDGEQYGKTIDGTSFETDSFSLNLVIPIYTGGSVSAARRQAYADYDQARETLAGAERGITQQVRAYHIAVLTHIQQVAARKQSITSNESALEAIQAGYNVGTRNVVDVLNAQRNLYAAQRDYANARYDYILSMIDLKKAAGLLTPADITALNQWLTTEQVTKQ